MKVSINGSAAVITSTLTLDDIATVAKYKPSALTLYGGENGKDPLFSIGVSSSPAGKINKFGAEFGTQTSDGGKATVTIIFGEPVEDVKGFIADKLGGALLNLKKLEESLPAVIEEITAAKAEVLADITVA